MKIVILANNLDFFNKYGNNSKCINFINDSDIFVRLKYKTKNLFGDRNDHLLINLNSKSFLKNLDYAKSFNHIIPSTPSSFTHQNNNKYSKKINNEIDFFKEFNDLKFTHMKINKKFNKYLELFQEKYILNGHKCILYYLSEYPNSIIYLLGFKYNDHYMRPDRKKTTKIAGCHSLKKNNKLLNNLLKEYTNLIVKNEF